MRTLRKIIVTSVLHALLNRPEKLSVEDFIGLTNLLA